MNYRKLIYQNYARDFTDAYEKPDVDRWAKSYRHYLSGWLPEEKNALILDAACGSGRCLNLLNHAGYQNIIGIDISPDQIQLASQISPSVHEANVLEWLIGKKDCFDLIIGLDIIEHLEKQEVIEFLSLLHSALKSNGRVILQTPNCESVFGSMIRYNDFSHEVGFTPLSLSRLMKITGFTCIECREIGPIGSGYSIRSTMRYIIWQLIRIFLKTYHLAETGSIGSNIYSRVFILSAIKK
jgi:2-polyprenyl-3-methyl-5-hydroxy-6-metoxy-1,4-benzoquinol methylase